MRSYGSLDVEYHRDKVVLSLGGYVDDPQCDCPAFCSEVELTPEDVLELVRDLVEWLATRWEE